jgi:hypothetical protein
MSEVSHILPVGVLVNAGLQVSGHNGTFLGSVSYAVVSLMVAGGPALQLATFFHTFVTA